MDRSATIFRSGPAFPADEEEKCNHTCLLDECLSRGALVDFVRIMI